MSKVNTKFRTTGIGSLPHTYIDAALEYSFEFDIPFLPQLPIKNAKEFMISQALEQLPGLESDESGTCIINRATWESKHLALQNRTEEAFRTSAQKPEAFESFEPSPESFSAWKPFLWELSESGTQLAKIEIAGPLTSQWVLRTDDGEAADRNPALAMQVFRLVLARAIGMSRRLASQNVQPLLFIDEPGLYGLRIENPRHIMAMSELRLFVETLRKDGAQVGLHCCSNTDWKTILQLPVDMISLDTNLSLNLLLTHQVQWKAFLKRGGVFSMGVVPTAVHPVKIRTFEPKLLAEQYVETLQAHVGDDESLLKHILESSVYTPACGLALHSIADAEAIRAELAEVVALLSR